MSSAGSQPAPWVCHDRDSPIVVHVPHAGTRIPDEVRPQILLDDLELEAEHRHMVDRHTDSVAQLLAGLVSSPPSCFINQLSRLVVDPERFDDEREEMLQVGMGPVYVTTSHLQPLRDNDPVRDRQLLENYFYPYADAFADLVDRTLDRHQRCTIIDLHSYPTRRLPYERHPTTPRPMTCIGTDSIHTPVHLQVAAVEAFSRIGDVALNVPFAGTYVPLRYYGHEPRVTSVMIELRRDTYLDDEGNLDEVNASSVASALGTLLHRVHEGL